MSSIFRHAITNGYVANRNALTSKANKSVEEVSNLFPEPCSYSANALNQLTSVDGSSRTHDGDGNLTDDGTRLYLWNAKNRLNEVKDKATNNVIATYAYDYQSRRIEKTESGVIESYVYDEFSDLL